MAYIGVDVGSASVRATLLSRDDQKHMVAIEQLRSNSPQPQLFEQSSEQIWNAVCIAVKRLLKENNIEPTSIRGIGFDATCSLVCLDENSNPVSVTPSNNLTLTASRSKNPTTIWNVIMWMDHRANEQAERINQTGHKCLEFVGKSISLEMEPPKILWLKENLPESFANVKHFMDLADFLTMKASGSSARSLCCGACKWTLQASESGATWDRSFWEEIGLSELCEDDFSRIGNQFRSPGQFNGVLTPAAADEMGLSTRVPVGTGIIDAHAGCLSMISTTVLDKDINDLPPTARLSMICGTSTCHMALSENAKFVPGVWGPFYGSILPRFWSTEAGQSSVGPILDYIVDHPLVDVPEIKCLRTADRHSWVQERLNDLKLADGERFDKIAQDIHVWPDYHGNRSPIADPRLTATVMGLKLPNNVDPKEYLLSVYMAHIEAFALMTRMIVESLAQGGYKIKVFHICGGLQKNRFYVQAHADACQLPVIVPNTEETVARGAAMLGACASGDYPSLQEAAKTFAPKGELFQPNPSKAAYFEKKYGIFKKLGDLQLEHVKG